MHDSNDCHPCRNHRMTIVLADADAHARDRLKKRLEKIASVTVVGESSDSDIAILNSSFRDGSGIDVLQHIRQLMVPPTIIVVTDDTSCDNKNAYSVAGADFFFDKAKEDRKLIDTVRLLCVPHSRIEALDSTLATLDD